MFQTDITMKYKRKEVEWNVSIYLLLIPHRNDSGNTVWQVKWISKIRKAESIILDQSIWRQSFLAFKKHKLHQKQRWQKKQNVKVQALHQNSYTKEQHNWAGGITGQNCYGRNLPGMNGSQIKQSLPFGLHRLYALDQS